MAEIVQANPANASLGQYGKEDTMVEVVRIENRSLRGSKNEFAGDVVLAFLVSLQQAPVSQFEEDSAELPGQIHPSRLPAFRRRVLAAHVVVLHHDEALGIMVTAELHVAPLHCHEFSPAQSGAHCHQEQGIVGRANLLGSLQKLLNLDSGYIATHGRDQN